MVRHGYASVPTVFVFVVPPPPRCTIFIVLLFLGSAVGGGGGGGGKLCLQRHFVVSSKALVKYCFL